MSEVPEGILDEFSEVGRRLAERGLVESASGNLSLRLDGDVVVTESGSFLDDLSRDSLVRLPMGSSREEASRDLDIHNSIYGSCGAGAVLHCHGVYNVVLSLRRDSVRPIDFEGDLFLGETEVVSNDDRMGIGEAFEEEDVVLAEGHGIYAAGEDLREAFQAASALERSCEILYRDLLLDSSGAVE